MTSIFVTTPTETIRLPSFWRQMDSYNWGKMQHTYKEDRLITFTSNQARKSVAIHPSTDTPHTTLTMMLYVLQYQYGLLNQSKIRMVKYWNSITAGLQKIQVKYLQMFFSVLKFVYRMIHGRTPHYGKHLSEFSNVDNLFCV